MSAQPALIPTGTWTADPAHSRFGFAVKHMGIATVRGEFTVFDGSLEIPDDLATASANGWVDVSSVTTGDAERDAHLRSPDFFDVDAHPRLTFRSSEIERADAESFRVLGDLTIRGVTQGVVLHADIQGVDVDPWGNERVGLEITGQISRADFGMRFNQMLGSGNALVADRVQLSLDISAVRQPSS